jgi:predicted secreted protein
MGLVSGIVVYLIAWWLVLFMVLPLGVRTPEEPEPGHAPSAPVRPRLRFKFLLTTIIAAAIWLIVFTLVEAEIVSFRDMVRGGR